MVKADPQEGVRKVLRVDPHALDNPARLTALYWFHVDRVGSRDETRDPDTYEVTRRVYSFSDAELARATSPEAILRASRRVLDAAAEPYVQPRSSAP